MPLLPLRLSRAAARPLSAFVVVVALASTQPFFFPFACIYALAIARLFLLVLAYARWLMGKCGALLPAGGESRARLFTPGYMLYWVAARLLIIRLWDSSL